MMNFLARTMPRRAWLATLPALSMAVFLPQVALAEDLGPAVGSIAPSIGSPPDQTGKPRSMSDLMGSKGLVLMFFRSAAWCPYCQAQLIDMNGGLTEIENRGYRVAALSYDAPKVLADFTEKRHIGFTFLSDPKSEVIDRYNLRDPQYPAGSFAYGVPRPIVFILDTHGVIKGKLFEETFKTRPPVSAVIAKIDAVDAGN